jgi:hypothetical protein
MIIDNQDIHRTHSTHPSDAFRKKRYPGRAQGEAAPQAGYCNTSGEHADA